MHSSIIILTSQSPSSDEEYSSLSAPVLHSLNRLGDNNCSFLSFTEAVLKVQRATNIWL